MASTTEHLFLFLTVLLGIFSISATARPCKAFFISTYSFTFKPQNPNLNPNPNTLLFLNPNPNPNPNPSGSLTIYTTEFEIFLDRRLPLDDESQIQKRQQNEHHHQNQRPVIPFGFSSYDMSSLRDRTKDILSVVVALLFGVGCGAFAAATLYLVWTLFANRYDYVHRDEFDVDEEDDVSVKKMGYVKILAADK